MNAFLFQLPKNVKMFWGFLWRLVESGKNRNRDANIELINNAAIE